METMTPGLSSRITTFAGILLVVVLLATGCAPARDQRPTQDQLLGRVMSTDSNSVQIVRREIRWFSADIMHLTTSMSPSTGNLTPLARSQLAGSIAGRFEALTDLGMVVMPLNKNDPAFDTVDSKQIQAARLMSDLCMACSYGPVASVEDIAGRVARDGVLTEQDAAYLNTLDSKLEFAAQLVGDYVIEKDPSVRTDMAARVAKICTELKGQ